MKPILYKSDETNFNTLGLGILSETIVCEVTEERNGLLELYLEYPVAGLHYAAIEDLCLIKAKPNSVDDLHLFRVYERQLDTVSQVLSVYATSISNDLGGNLVQTVSATGVSPQTALDTMKANLLEETDFLFHTDINTTNDVEWKLRNPLNCIAGEEGSLLDVFGGEIKRGNSFVWLYARRGRDNVTTVRHGKNLTGLEVEYSTKGLITKILPYFTNTPEGSEVEETITGDLVVSQYAGNYPVTSVLPVDYSSDERVTDLASLNTVAADYFTENTGVDRPSLTMQVELDDLSDSSEYEQFKALENIELCDTITVYAQRFDVNVTAKVTKLVYDSLREKNKSLDVGSIRTSFYEAVKSGYKDLVKDVEVTLNNTIEKAANGKNRVFRGIDEPVTGMIKNDVWYKPVNDGEIEMYVFDGAYWELQAFSGISEATKKEVEDVIAQADADRLKAEAGFESAIITSKAYTDTKAAEFNTEMEVVKTDLVTTMTKADKAVLDAETAIAEAGFAKLDATTAKENAVTAIENANEAKTNAGTAISTANTAKTNAGTALTAAQTAVANSGTALTNAQTALDRVGEVEEETGTLQTSYDALTQTVGLKADKTTVNGITQTVTQQGLDITANATAVGLKADKTAVDTISQTVTKHTTDIKATSDGLALKAEKSVVDSINSTVDTHTTQIKATSDGLALKADSSLVNTINGTVNTHTGQISANSTAIAARLTSAQVDSLVAAKKYVNETTLNATASGLSTSITKVSSDLSNLKIGGRNLLRNTSNPTGYENLSSASGSYSSIYTDPIKGTVFERATTGTSETYIWTSRTARVDVSTEYTFSCDLWVNEPVSSVDLFWLSDTDASPQGGSGYVNVTVSSTIAHVDNVWQRVVWTFTTKANDRTGIFRIDNNGSKVSGTNAIMRVTNVKLEKGNKATDWTPAPEDLTTLEKFTTLEATVNGINTVVGTKADQSQITQLSGQISSKVESSIYNSKMTQLDNAINLRVQSSDVTAAILEDKIVKDTRNDNQLPNWYLANYPKQVVEELKLRSVMGVPLPGSAYGQLTTNVTWSDTGTGGFIQTFRASDGVFQRSSNASTNTWGAWDKIAETGKLISQINISTEGILLQGKRIQLDGDVTMTNAFVDRLNVNTLSVVYADIATLKTKVLTTDVVTSTHLKSDTALITKLFATDANVNVLTAKTAFINSIKAITISADKITAGTLNAANVNIINLNVSKLTGDITSFVQSAWNAINGTVSITGDGIVSSNSVGRFVHYTNGGLVFGGGGERTVLRNNTGATINRSGISLEPVGSNLNAVDFDIATRGTSSFHMGTSDLDLGYRLRLSNDDSNTNNYYVSLKTGTKFDFRLNNNSASGTNKNNLEIEVVDAAGTLRVGKNEGYGSSMFLSGNDIIFARGGTASRVNVYASKFIGTGFTYLEGTNVYSIEKTISHIIQQLQWYTSYFSATKWQNV